jgi:hypothetical protein
MTTNAGVSWQMSAGSLQGGASNNSYRIVADADPTKADVFINNSTTTPNYTAIIAGLSQWTLTAVPGDQLTVDFSNGNPLPSGGLVFSGTAGNGGNGLTIVGTSGNDSVVATPTQITVNGAAPINYTNVSSFQFHLGAGQDSLIVNGASLSIVQNSAISSGTAVTVIGAGVINLGGTSDTIFGAISNNSTATAGIVVSGTNQVVGSVNGTGNLAVNARSDLTAAHINQSALIIGGAAGNSATVTIAASDVSGNPLAEAPAPATDSAVAASTAGNAAPVAVSTLDAVVLSGTAPNPLAVSILVAAAPSSPSVPALQFTKSKLHDLVLERLETGTTVGISAGLKSVSWLDSLAISGAARRGSRSQDHDSIFAEFDVDSLVSARSRSRRIGASIT